METYNKHKTLVVRLTKEEHQQIKLEALKRNIPISKLVKRALIQYVAKEGE